MSKLSLKQKFLFLVFVIAMICPIVSGIIIMRNESTMAQFKVIADRSLPRTRQMNAVLSGFRQLRIEVRSLAIRGNTQSDFDHILKNIDKAMAELVTEKNNLLKEMTQSDEEIVMGTKIEEAWKKFENLGTEILALYKKGDEASLNKMADLVRVSCPLIAKELDGAVAKLSEWQTVSDVKRVEEAIAHSKVTTDMSVALAFVGIICSLLVGGVFASSITKNITKNIKALSQSAHEIHQKSQDMSKISTDLSEAAAQQAASLQETVASIDEISAMVARNSDSAVVSVENSEKSTMAVRNGKENVQLMMNSIHSIEAGNKEVMEKIQNSNKEISEIVLVIRDIATKTKVINDIVFQTKLLSFNASVEAARAGEHGRGFSVVAEEIGNLATMSGTAANEISMMLDSSVKSVSDIVERTTTMMDALIKKNTEKVEQGIFTARQCTESLEDILSNVARVNQLVNEISLSSQEQATGIKEINKTMIELDDVTQQNSNSAQNSSQAALVLNGQVDRLNTIVSDLSLFIEGKAA